MSWAGLANNQTVSFNNLQNAVDTSVFTVKNTIPSSNEQITKSDADFYVYIQAIPSKSNNQLVVKSNLTAETINSVTIWFNNIQDGDPPYPYGYIDAGTACSQGGNSGAFATVYYTGILGDGTVLYNDSGLTQNFGYAGSIFWYWINFHKFTYDFGSIADYSVCD
jgi:hypothetical protein